MCPIQDGIMAELRKGDRNAGELKDNLGIRSYPELWSAIASLEKAEKVHHYFKETPPSVTLTYYLIKKEPRATFWPQQKSEQSNHL
jgi:hypothetical protein